MAVVLGLLAIPWDLCNNPPRRATERHCQGEPFAKPCLTLAAGQGRLSPGPRPCHDTGSQPPSVPALGVAEGRHGDAPGAAAQRLRPAHPARVVRTECAAFIGVAIRTTLPRSNKWGVLLQIAQQRYTTQLINPCFNNSENALFLSCCLRVGISLQVISPRAFASSGLLHKST